MSDSLDLQRILRTWPYDPENDARIVPGSNDRQILQVRTPLGIEQLELDGRPDGLRPHDMESALEFHQRRLETARIRGEADEFQLSEEECSELFAEGTLYYLRYVRLFQLRDWPRTIRDTARNLRAFDLVRDYADREEDETYLEKWRPYVLRVHATAVAMRDLEKQAFGQAVAALNEAISKIEALPDLDDETFEFERDRSLTALRELAVSNPVSAARHPQVDTWNNPPK